MNLWRAWWTLVVLSFRRLLWSSSTLMIAFPILGCLLFLLRRPYGQSAGADALGVFSEAFVEDFDRFSARFVVVVFASFIVPIVALAYATTSIGGDREDRTLLFLLVRPIPRALIVLGKFSATLPLVVGITVGSFYLYCSMAGDVGRLALELYLPGVFFMTIAYACLFHLFAVVFRHATIVALVYALFIEFFVGNMPGVIKRLTVSYYGRSIIYYYQDYQLQLMTRDAPSLGDIDSPYPQWFEPISAHAAGVMLLGIAAASLLAALVIFHRREYRDLA